LAETIGSAGKGRLALGDDDGSHVPARRGRRRRWLVAGVVLTPWVLLVMAIFWNSWFHGNFGVVDPGLVYRSAQPGRSLGALIRQWRVASVLNLRGGNLENWFYANEVHETQALGVDYYDFPMSAIRRPTRKELLVLLDLFGRCRYPLLIHCKSGADRTGLVSALYLMDRSGKPPEKALDAFSLFFGHVPIGNTARLHEPFDEYARWLKANKLEHTPSLLRKWVERDYRSDDPPRSYPPLPTGPRPHVDSSLRRASW
jgi:protein tyrosine phosphatase (PTP) superfamily phosphohydrolase (DUF442 family)